jgi:hypothetical protein
MKLLDGPRSMVAALRAARYVGLSSNLFDTGQLDRAHTLAQQGLALLHPSYVNRQSPPVASALASLTILAEQSAPAPGSGASRGDLADSLAFLRSITGTPEPELCQWIPFLEARLLAQPG